MSDKVTIADSKFLNEWDSSKNQEIPASVFTGSNKNFWWKCSKGHSFMSPPYKRARGDGCPYCSNRRVLRGYNDLATTNPELLLEWDFETNIISPYEIVPGSTKKVNWVCRDCGNRWTTAARNRANRPRSCPKCATKKRAYDRHVMELKRRGCLSNKVLLQDFDFEANSPLKPEDFTKSANVKIHWICHNCGYKWIAKINNRANGRNCPACSNKVVYIGHNDLKTTHPLLSKEWHPTKNGELKPTDVTFGYGKKVWWKCPQGHEYQATVNKRTSGNGTNCPICASGSQTSFAEQAVFFYVKKIFPDAINRYRADFLGQMELDIYIPSYRTGIEYDGEAWHKEDKWKRELQKRKRCNENGIRLWRLRESPLKGEDVKLADHCIHIEKMYEHDKLNHAIHVLISDLLLSSLPITFSIDVDRDRNEILEYKQAEKESIEKTNPELLKEWDYSKNGNLIPKMFSAGSDHKVWWLCPDCGNSYEATIAHRAKGTKCRACFLKKLPRTRIRAVLMIDPQTKVVLKEFDSISDAARELKINGANIGSVCRGDRPFAGGYIWKYKK